MLGNTLRIFGTVAGDDWVLEQSSYCDFVGSWSKGPESASLSYISIFHRNHIHLNILFKTDGWGKGLYNKAQAIVEPGRLQNRARVMTRESGHDRPAMLGAALTKWTRGSVPKTDILLSENVDVLSSLARTHRDCRSLAFANNFGPLTFSTPS